MLELRSISKSFTGLQALAEVSLRFSGGEIHGLVGENGAGKSTLLKILSGVYQPDSGSLALDGRPVRLRDCYDALRRGICIVHQEIQVIPESTIAENVMLDKLPTRGRTGIVDWSAANRRAGEFTSLVGLGLPPSTVVKDLSAAQKQLIQLAKALAANARVLLLDEPTSSLTEHEARELQRILLRLKSQGVAIVYVSHKLEEVFALCDRVSVLRDGRHVGTKPAAEFTPATLVKLMIGREAPNQRLGALRPDRNREALRAEHLTRRGKVHDVSFTLHPGEILGFYGLVGAGRTETARLIIGDDVPDSGEVFVHGRRARIRGIQDSLHLCRIGYVSENRKEEGLLLDAPVGDNITITVWKRLRHWLSRRINPTAERAIARDLARSLAIKCAGLDQATRYLSGGNQQKVCMAKWLAADCDILIIDEPTVGVDIGAKEQIHRLIWDLAVVQGKAVILISSDLLEIIKLASRILVFRDKRIVGEISDLDAPNRAVGEISQAIGQFLN